MSQHPHLGKSRSWCSTTLLHTPLHSVVLQSLSSSYVQPWRAALFDDNTIIPDSLVITCDPDVVDEMDLSLFLCA
jgi:hypothetical protein